MRPRDGLSDCVWTHMPNGDLCVPPPQQPELRLFTDFFDARRLFATWPTIHNARPIEDERRTFLSLFKRKAASGSRKILRSASREMSGKGSKKHLKMTRSGKIKHKEPSVRAKMPLAVQIKEISPGICRVV